MKCAFLRAKIAGHTQNSVDMLSINLRVNSIFAIFGICKKERPIRYRRHHVCYEKQAGLAQ